MKTVIGMTLALLIGGLAMVLGTAPRAYTCALTGESSAECCCIEKDGSLYCPRAEKSLDECCCISS